MLALLLIRFSFHLALIAPCALGFGSLKPANGQRSVWLTSPSSSSSSSRIANYPLVPCTLTSLQAIGGIDQATVADLAQSLFRYSGKVPFFEALGINAVLFAALKPKLFKMLTPSGYVNSFFLGTMLWNTLGWRGWTLCVCYLFLGQAVTKVRFTEKENMGIAEARGGRRGPENVWGSAATGLVCAVCAAQGETFLGISKELFLLAYVASLATKLADTFASEIGKAYGRTTFLITTFERVNPGTEGAISAEGSAASVVGGLLLATYGYFVGLIDLPSVGIATVAAFLATNVESLIGATLQEKKGFKWMTNEVVNFINTLVGAGFAIFGGMALL